MQNINMVMYAGMICWTTIGLYVFFLAQKQKRLQTRVEHMEKMLEKK